MVSAGVGIVEPAGAPDRGTGTAAAVAGGCDGRDTAAADPAATGGGSAVVPDAMAGEVVSAAGGGGADASRAPVTTYTRSAVRSPEPT